MDEFIFINDARVSFPALFKKPIINGDEGSYGGKLCLEEGTHDTVKSQILKGIQDILDQNNEGMKLTPDRYCIRSGEYAGRAEYKGFLAVVSANSTEKPIVIDATGKNRISDPEESKIYSGCRVNAKVRLWWQNNKWGKRVNANLVAIQFAGHDEPFSANHVDEKTATEGFGTAATGMEGGASAPAEQSGATDAEDLLG